MATNEEINSFLDTTNLGRESRIRVKGFILDNEKKIIEDVEKIIDLKFASINDYLNLIIDEDMNSDEFNKDDILNCIHEYGDEIKDLIKGSKE